MRKRLILPLLFAYDMAASGIAVAAEHSPPAESRPDNAKRIAALMEYIGGWEKSNGQWVDPLVLESGDSPEQEGNDSNEQPDDGGEGNDETE